MVPLDHSKGKLKTSRYWWSLRS